MVKKKYPVNNDWIYIVTIIPVFSEMRPKDTKDISSFENE
jgi:hypothetical protein